MFAALPVMALRAQETPVPGPTAPSGRPIVACMGQRINDITVFSEAPSVANLQRAPVLARMAGALHVTTRADLIRQFLFLEPGDPCSELRRAESERILRAQPFIADAHIFVVPGDSGGVDLEVRTSDETSIVLGGTERAKTPYFTSLLLGSANLAGEGIFTSGWWRYGEGFRDAVGGRLVNYQFLGNPMVYMLDGERASQGGQWHTELMRPFYTDLQRIAWSAQAGMSSGYLQILMPNGDVPAVNVNRNYFDVGGVARIGPPGRLGLLGLSLTGDDENANNQLINGDSGFARVVGTLPQSYGAHRVARANFLFGLRDITFERREGLDALTGAQDVPLGVQVGGMVGRSVRSLGAREDDSFVASDLYAGAASGIDVLRVQFKGEARHGLGLDYWDSILTSGRITQTLQFSPWHVNQLNLEWSGAYHLRTPFQLFLGVPDGGIRGYEESNFAGGQRLIARAEERFVLGKFLNQAEAGIAFFADAGRQWAGDVPFGVTTGVKSSVGIGLLAAVPPRSTRLWRMDLAIPLNTGAGSAFVISFTNVDRTNFVFREPRDVADAREPTVPSSIFAWP
jgi:hypothetical protein